MYSCFKSGNDGKCPFCNSDQNSKTRDVQVEDNMKRVEANDAGAICQQGGSYYHGLNGFQQDHAKAMELFTKSADLGFSEAHFNLANIYHEGGDLKKAKFHFEAAAMAGDEVSICIIGTMEYKSGNMQRALKHWMISASAGEYGSMNNLLIAFKGGAVSRESIESTLAVYNSSCAEMRSESRDACIQIMAEAAQAQL